MGDVATALCTWKRDKRPSVKLFLLPQKKNRIFYAAMLSYNNNYYNLKLVMATGTGTSLSMAHITGSGIIRDTPIIHMLSYRQDSKVWITGKGIQGFADMLGLQTDFKTRPETMKEIMKSIHSVQGLESHSSFASIKWQFTCLTLIVCYLSESVISKKHHISGLPETLTGLLLHMFQCIIMTTDVGIASKETVSDINGCPRMSAAWWKVLDKNYLS